MIVLIDIDHTLADAVWRDTMIPGGWDEYHAASINDKPIKAMVDLVNTLTYGGGVVCAITARPEKWRELTMQWLLKHNIAIDKILMRKNNDYRPSPIVKLENAILAFGLLKNIDLVIDDRDDVCTAFRAHGVTTLQSFAAAGQRDESTDSQQELAL